MDANGCMMPDTCVPMEGTLGTDGTPCPGVCPPACAAGDMTCPGGIGPNGCPTADTCMPSEGPIGADGTQCPSVCPVVCGEDTMWCHGGMDANGCMMPNTCVQMQGPQLGNDGNPCPGHCPPACAPGDMICPGFIDPNGCPLQETCIAPGLDCPVAPATGPACAFMAEQPEKYQDRICDDELNTPECNYDGGDCCVHKVDNWNERCTACECLGLNCPKKILGGWGNGKKCQGKWNKAGCFYDGGDCCKNPNGKKCKDDLAKFKKAQGA